MQVGDALLRDDVREVVAVDHHRRQIETSVLGQLDGVELLHEAGGQLLAERLLQLHHKTLAARQIAHQLALDAVLLAALEPARRRMAAALRIAAHVGRAAEPGHARGGGGAGVTILVDLQRAADEQVERVMAGRLRERAVGAHGAVRPHEEHIGAGRHVVLHAHLAAERVDGLHPARLDGGNERGMRIEREVRADLALEPQLLAVGGQQELDGSGVEADAVVEALDAVLAVDALDNHHGAQHLRVGDEGGVAREQRLHVERLGALHHEVHPVAGDVHPRHLVNDLVHLGHHNALLELRRLHDDGRVLGVEAREQVAVLVGAHGHGQRHARRKIHEVAAVQLQIGVNGADLYLALAHVLGQTPGLRPGEREVQLLGNALVKHIQVGAHGQHRLHHVQVMHLRRVDLAQALG